LRDSVDGPDVCTSVRLPCYGFPVGPFLRVGVRPGLSPLGSVVAAAVLLLMDLGLPSVTMSQLFFPEIVPHTSP